MDDIHSRDVALFTEAIHLPSRDRPGYLERECGEDDALRRRVDALVHAYEELGDFLENPTDTPSALARRHRPASEKARDRIGRYRLLKELGEGGCGVVFLAEQEGPIRRRVALKIIKPGMDTRSVIARFEAERQALALMDHPSIAKVFDAGETDSGRPYFVMELVRGIRITDYCDQNSVPTAERLALFVQVCRAVQHAHQKGIIHRDLKPSNILVTTSADGAPLPVVIDFGIAKVTTNQPLADGTIFTVIEMLIGTPAYMSPEQTELIGGDADTRTDIYSLGVLFYELLTGFTPLDSGRSAPTGLDEIRRAIREQEPLRPSARLSKLREPDLVGVSQRRRTEPIALIRAVRGDLDWIAMKALEKDRTRRYETATGLANDVERFLANEPILARPASTMYRLQKTLQRNKLLFSALAALGLLVVAALVAVSAAFARERQARREAEADRAQAQAEAAKSRQVTAFLEDMLQGVGPSVAIGRDTTLLREILDKAASRIDAALPDQPATRGDLQSVIGGVYLELGLWDQAEAMQRAALAVYRRQFGEENPKVAESLDNLGQTLFQKNDPAGAEQCYREALAIERRIFRNPNPATARTEKDLAGVLFQRVKLSEAEALVRDSLAMREELSGDESLDVADSLNGLGIVLSYRGDLSDAESVFRQVLQIRRRRLDPEHPLVASALANLASVLNAKGDRDQATSMLRDALAMERRLAPGGSRFLVKCLLWLGELQFEQGKLQEARAFLREAITIDQKLGPLEPYEAIYAINRLAMMVNARRDPALAERIGRELLTEKRAICGDASSTVAQELDDLVFVLLKERKFDVAEGCLASFLTPEFVARPQSAGALAVRADFFAQRGRWNEAAADAAKVMEYRPGYYRSYQTLAPLLLRSGREDAYQDLRHGILLRFGGITEPFEAATLAADCLLLPCSGADLSTAAALADTAVTQGADYGDDLSVFQACKALAEYRQDHCANAAQWAEKSCLAPNLTAQGIAYPVLAMANGRLHRLAEARIWLDKAFRLPPRRLGGSESDEWESHWQDGIVAQVLLEEAKVTVGPVRPKI